MTWGLQRRGLRWNGVEICYAGVGLSDPKAMYAPREGRNLMT